MSNFVDAVQLRLISILLREIHSTPSFRSVTRSCRSAEYTNVSSLNAAPLPLSYCMVDAFQMHIIVLHKGISDYQEIPLLDTKRFGKYITASLNTPTTPSCIHLGPYPTIRQVPFFFFFQIKPRPSLLIFSSPSSSSLFFTSPSIIFSQSSRRTFIRQGY
ncbi:putative protein serine/threonine kinase [Trifolium repens]|nr:putative protein serine/threonine kinase [Trifolium repens]